MTFQTDYNCENSEAGTQKMRLFRVCSTDSHRAL